MKYYKAMNKDFTCRGFQYEIGKTYKLPRSQKLKLCENGFHFCDILNDCFGYYDKDDCIVCEVEPIGKIVGDVYSNKHATDKIKIIRQLSNKEIERERFLVQEGVKRIDDFAFFNCKSLKKIKISNSVTTIGSYAFCDCKSLKEIKIPDNVTSIDNYAFWCSNNLQKIYVSKNFNLDILENCILGYDRHKEKCNYLLDKVEIVRI